MTIQLRASGAGRWMRCAAAPRFATAVPETTNDAAREGTCAAWVAETVIQSTERIDADDMLGKMHSNGWVVDDEMANHVSRYIDVIGRDSTVEQSVSLWDGLILGTFDAKKIVGRTLYLIDLKYGYKVVNVKSNWQVIVYTLGCWNDDWDNACVSIYQPRASHPDGILRSVWYTREELSALAAELYAGAINAHAAEPMAVPGSHCDDCPAAATCRALAESNYIVGDVIRSPMQHTMTPDEISAELTFLRRAAAMIDARLTAVAADAESLIAAGRIVPGWMMRAGTGHRKWNVDPAVVEIMTGKPAYRQVLRTPAEIERDGGDVTGLTTKPATRRKLVPFDDADVRQAFSERK